MDTLVVCRDGVSSQNKLTLGLVLPGLKSASVFDMPMEHTIIMPEHSVTDLQKLINELFPSSEINNSSLEIKSDNIEVNMEDSNSFEHFLETENNYEPMQTFGLRRGRGRPALNTSRLPPRFQCDYCSKGFYYKSMLTAHEKLHTGGTRETCEHC